MCPKLTPAHSPGQTFAVSPHCALWPSDVSPAFQLSWPRQSPLVPGRFRSLGKPYGLGRESDTGDKSQTAPPSRNDGCGGYCALISRYVSWERPLFSNCSKVPFSQAMCQNTPVHFPAISKSQFPNPNNQIISND